MFDKNQSFNNNENTENNNYLIIIIIIIIIIFNNKSEKYFSSSLLRLKSDWIHIAWEWVHGALWFSAWSDQARVCLKLYVRMS